MNSTPLIFMIAASRFAAKRAGLFDRLHAQLGLVEHLDHDAVGISAVKRRAAVAVKLERVHDRHAPGAKLLFQLFTDREERRAIAIATNAPFSEWPKTFTDQRLCRAIVDRMTFNANIIETGSQSYRVHSTQARLRERA